MKRFKGIAPYITAIFVCIFVSFPAVSQSVVLDEAYSAGLVRGNIPSIIHGAAIDVHPPLYYLILKVSRFFGGEIQACDGRRNLFESTFAGGNIDQKALGLQSINIVYFMVWPDLFNA